MPSAAPLVCLPLAALALGGAAAQDRPMPGEVFDLSLWNVTLPVDENGDEKPDTITVRDIQRYEHPVYFHLDDEQRLVFTAPNKGAKTPNTTNTRSELREMLRGTNTRYKTHGAENNWAVEARKGSSDYGRVGGMLQATLHVDHVALRAGKPDKASAYSAVVGQIHAVKYDNTSSGFGYGNEPIKIYYKKWPGHETGSLFWTYERNLAKTNPDRRDIAYPVYGNLWDNPDDPGAEGIALGEEFSYTINVHRNTMYVAFDTARHGPVVYKKSLVSNVDAYGEVDELDNRFSYGGDSLFFKAGIYNQCSTSDKPGFWYAACPGTGEWAVDEANGDYARATFSRIEISGSVPPQAMPTVQAMRAAAAAEAGSEANRE